jgi:hypothetical protein
MKTQQARLLLFCTPAIATPQLPLLRAAGAAEKALDAASRNQWPATGRNRRSDESFVHPTVAQHAPVYPDIHEMQPMDGEGAL